MDGRAAKARPLRREQVAVRRVGAEQLDDLVDEELRTVSTRSSPVTTCAALTSADCWAEAELVLGQEPRGVDPHPELARDRLAQANLAVGPDVPPGPVDGEHADRAIEDDDRRREGRPRAQGEEDGAALVLELRLDVGDCNGAAGPRGDVRTGRRWSRSE